MKILEDQKKQDNTVGSRSKTHLAYIAGFLDGDGSVMLQVKKRKDGALKRRFMTTICFYQDTRHEKNLYWIQKILRIGYISRRNDGMTELRINGYSQVNNIIKLILPYVKFKKLQCEALLKACKVLLSTTLRKLDKKQLLKIADCILVIQNENYVTKRKKTKEELFKMLDLTP
ncbi:MAG: LAGLIDADG family homing endonuclease [bacterium]|nr:LAGLIDADG family homing endonuclease [bacterium]